MDDKGELTGDGTPVAVNPTHCSQVVTDSRATSRADSSAKNALANAERVLRYYHDVHGRDGFDDHGSQVVNVVHVGFRYGNAAWVRDQDYMMYGDGDGKDMGDMTTGVDVAGHELTHGITAKTAKLSMMDEPGALNEAYSDFFGKVIADNGSWVIGASLSLDRKRFAGIRDLADPHSLQHPYRNAQGELVEGPYPADTSEMERKLSTTKCDGSNDRCWVHHNSTIPSHASYLIYQAIGAEKTEALYYLTLTHFLTSEASFEQAAQATLSACHAKFDTDTCDQVRKAFVKTGMLSQ
jgi:Zn-dependent metalloprotease